MYTLHEDGVQAPSGATFRRARQSGARSHAPAVQNRRVPILLLLSLTFFSLLLSACPLYNPAAFIKGQPGPGDQRQAGADDISSTATQATLQWDPPATGSSQVVSYTISYRIHGTTTWTTLATIPATSQPEYTVLRSTLGSGSFDFAVVAVDGTGAISPLHTSLDATADPTSGWYLTWGQ